jgi:hypothetical protein
MKTTALLSILAWAGSVGSALSEGVSPKAAFDSLKALEGRWEGHIDTPDGPESAVEYRLTSGGTTVMEVLFPGTEHEMVTIYYLDGDELRAKHFCAMANQPEMRLDAKASSENELRFTFSGGTNMDPAKDVHMHGGKLAIQGDRLTSEWAVYTGGKEDGANRFYLSRVGK